MSQFKILQGNYTELTHLLIPGLENQNADIEAVWDLIKIDLPRTAYFSENNSVESLQKRLQEEFFASSAQNQYDQGGFAGGLGVWYISCSKQFQIGLPEYTETYGLEADVFFSYLSVCYSDDNDNLCGFSIVVAVDPLSLKEDHFRYRYTITIYRNITAAPENREVTYITDVELLMNKRLGETIPSSDILNTVEESLNSMVLYEAIEPIIAGQDYAARTAFDNLKACLVTNRNSYTWVKKLNNVQQAEVISYKDQLDKIFHSEKSNVLKRSFFRRNGPDLLFLFVSASIGMSVFFLTMPLTIVFAAALSVILGLFAGTNILKNVNSLKRYQENQTLETSLATEAFNDSISHAGKSLVSSPENAVDPALEPVVYHKSPYLSKTAPALPPETPHHSISPTTV